MKNLHFISTSIILQQLWWSVTAIPNQACALNSCSNIFHQDQCHSCDHEYFLNPHKWFPMCLCKLNHLQCPSINLHGNIKYWFPFHCYNFHTTLQINSLQVCFMLSSLCVYECKNFRIQAIGMLGSFVLRLKFDFVFKRTPTFPLSCHIEVDTLPLSSLKFTTFAYTTFQHVIFNSIVFLVNILILVWSCSCLYACNLWFMDSKLAWRWSTWFDNFIITIKFAFESVQVDMVQVL